MCQISEAPALGINDAMILNVFESTQIPYLVTTDFILFTLGLHPEMVRISDKNIETELEKTKNEIEKFRKVCFILE